MDTRVIGVMSESTQSLHKQNTRLRMDLVSLFDGFNKSLAEVYFISVKLLTKFGQIVLLRTIVVIVLQFFS